MPPSLGRLVGESKGDLSMGLQCDVSSGPIYHRLEVSGDGNIMAVMTGLATGIFEVYLKVSNTVCCWLSVW